KIIGTIDEIAFQTNILALNAAIEAARAGDADEVRRLARRSAEAARETAHLIEAAVQKSEQGAQITARVDAALEQIISDARQVNQLVAEISHSCRQEDVGVRQIEDALNRIKAVTQTNAREAETSSEAATALRKQSM